MTPEAHLFYPENDLALARNIENYTPPSGAVAMHLSGEMLPLWYGGDGDRVICTGVNDAWYRVVTDVFGITVDVYDGNAGMYAPRPWGWSKAVRRAFMHAGFESSQLPDDDALETMRQKSGRGSSVQIARRLRESVDFDIADAPVECSDVDSAISLIGAYGGRAMVKSPWSNAGRGIFATEGMSAQVTASKIRGLIGAYGSVTVERYYDRVVDFAMLFDARHDGAVDYVGLSLFDTDKNGGYAGNVLLSDSRIEDWLGRFVPLHQIETVRSQLPAILSQFINGEYDGPLGVDMLIGRDDAGSLVLDPVVELNLRNTMGHVAHGLVSRYIAQDALRPESRFVIKPADASRTVSQTLQKCEVRNGRMEKGMLCLNPPGTSLDFVVQL